jgi:hypothetical protein
MAQYPIKLVDPPGAEEMPLSNDPRPQMGAHVDEQLYRFIEEQLDGDVSNLDKLLEVRRE